MRPDPLQWARKLHEAAAELRGKASRTPHCLKLAGRLERYAEAILSPHLPQGEHLLGASYGDD